MNKRNLLVRYDKDLRLRISYPGARQEITNDVVRVLRRAPGRNVVSFTFANEAMLDRVIDREVDYLLPMKQPFAWKVYDHDLLPSLKDRLVSHGFKRDDEPVDVMILDAGNSPASLSGGLNADIRRVADASGLEDVVQVLDKVWGGDNTWVHEILGPHLQVSGYLSVYVAYLDDQPASTAWTRFPLRGHFATLSAGSTIPEFRRRGLYTSLLETRISEVRERGYPYAVVDTGAMELPILARYGFQHLTRVHNYEWKGN